MTRMKLHLFRYECKNCGNIFKFPELFGNPYGEFLLKSKSGKMAYLNAIDSNVFKEFSGLLKSNEKIIGMQDTKRAKILHHIFDIACDNAPDGSVYGIMQKPACTNCGKSSIGHWGPTNPPEIVELDVPNVTYEQWNKLSNAEKKIRIDETVERVLQNEKNFGIL